MEVLPLNDHVFVGEAVLPKEMDKGVYVGVEDDDDESKSEAADDGLGDIWNEMAMAIEWSKDVTEEASNMEQKQEEKEDC